jgi:hypothetical protein
LEAETCVNFQDNDVLAIDDVEDLLLLLGHLLLKTIKVLHDLSRTSKGGGRGNVVQRSCVSQHRGAGRSKELLVSGRHLEDAGSVIDVLDKLATEEDNAEKPRLEATEAEADDDNGRIKSQSVWVGRRKRNKTRIQNKHVELESEGGMKDLLLTGESGYLPISAALKRPLPCPLTPFPFTRGVISLIQHDEYIQYLHLPLTAQSNHQTLLVLAGDGISAEGKSRK